MVFIELLTVFTIFILSFIEIILILLIFIFEKVLNLLTKKKGNKYENRRNVHKGFNE